MQLNKELPQEEIPESSLPYKPQPEPTLLDAHNLHSKKPKKPNGGQILKTKKQAKL